MNLLLAIFLIVFEAVYEGLATGGNHITSELAEFVYLFGVSLMAFGWLNYRNFITAPKLNSFIKILIGYLLLRFALFDVIWNISAGQDLFFYGTTKLYDRIMAELGSFGLMLKCIALVWGIAWLTRWGNKK